MDTPQASRLCARAHGLPFGNAPARGCPRPPVLQGHPHPPPRRSPRPRRSGDPGDPVPGDGPTASGPKPGRRRGRHHASGRVGPARGPGSLRPNPPDAAHPPSPRPSSSSPVLPVCPSHGQPRVPAVTPYDSPESRQRRCPRAGGRQRRARPAGSRPGNDVAGARPATSTPTVSQPRLYRFVFMVSTAHPPFLAP
ncbi:acidic proline-rich protein PRP25-like [Tachyglossus aculeatus]|uniref:acidic proline-rich protein PRP25-like n=1 Tax=Tachyglossus aculeatus TaxID=9261 RepID=UPI0018F70457|nr:acidic proline-rich protein PRP25-like [Tachyglossus aculeatus]